MKLNQIEEWKLMPPRGHWRPNGWRWMGWVNGTASYRKSDLVAQISAHLEKDEQRWLHLSISHYARLPMYEELVDARRSFLASRIAYQLFVPPGEHVNIHPNCLHLWAPVDHRPTPDFRGSEDEI